MITAQSYAQLNPLKSDVFSNFMAHWVIKVAIWLLNSKPNVLCLCGQVYCFKSIDLAHTRTQRHFARPGIEPETFWLLARYPNRSATWLPDCLLHARPQYLLRRLCLETRVQLIWRTVDGSNPFTMSLTRSHSNSACEMFSFIHYAPSLRACAYARCDCLHSSPYQIKLVLQTDLDRERLL